MKRETTGCEIIGILGNAQRVAFLTTLIKENTLAPKKNIALLDQEGSIIFSNNVTYEENITKYPEAQVRVGGY